MFQVTAIYPDSSVEDQQHYAPAQAFRRTRHATFKAAKSACLRLQHSAPDGVVVEIVDLKSSQVLTPNRYGRYEGYE